MPEDYEYRGPGERYYPASRDAFGVPLGTVQVGDTARLDEPPDGWWVPYEGGGGAGTDGTADEAGSDTGTSSSDEAGVTGSEEG